jgi:hypothetical protein
MRPRGQDWSDWRIRGPQNLAKFGYAFHVQGICRQTHVHSTKSHIYPGCWGEYAADQASRGIRNVDQAACGTHPAIPVKYARNWILERTTGSRTRVSARKRRENTEPTPPTATAKRKETYKYSEASTRRSTLVGYPEREEPEQPGCDEGNCEISPWVKQSVSVSNGREELWRIAHERDKKCHDTQLFHPTVTDDSAR